MRPRTTIRRHESAEGGWLMAERPPAPALAGSVLRYTGYVERTVAPLRRRESAQDCVTLILSLGPRLTVSGPGLPAAEHDSFVAPVGDSWAITEFTGVTRGIQVDLSPLAARALIGVPLRPEDPLVVDLDDLPGGAGAGLVERLDAAPTWDARFDLLDRTIGRALEERDPPLPADVVRAWGRLQSTSGRLPIGDLAQELGCSRRHLVGRFRDHVGPPPKLLARIMRFRAAVDALERDDGRRLAEIAQRCGYYDQAHLNRDFRELSGTTPTAYVGRRLTGFLGVGA